MGSKRIEQYLKRRMLTDKGWVYFCTSCGDYKPEAEFYRSKSTPFGLTYKCRIHYKKSDTPSDPAMDYLKLNPLSDKDFEDTQLVLEKLGYAFGPDQLPVWRQFEIKHNLK
jgi:hypothetical protein